MGVVVFLVLGVVATVGLVEGGMGVTEGMLVVAEGVVMVVEAGVTEGVVVIVGVEMGVISMCEVAVGVSWRLVLIGVSRGVVAGEIGVDKDVGICNVGTEWESEFEAELGVVSSVRVMDTSSDPD